jgi:hypothetical protein
MLLERTMIVNAATLNKELDDEEYCHLGYDAV